MTQNWRRWSLKIGLMSGLAITEPLAGCLGISWSANPAHAQVVEDSSLNTAVNQTGTTFAITGGTTAGGRNLFHSFRQFDLRNGEIADFQHAAAIANIFTRVIGGSPSNIDGIIRTTIQGQVQNRGTTNLFLMNPNGIIFGPNARLNVSGSFVATTANAIQFPSGTEFSLTSSVNPQNQLLSVNPSAFLFNQINAASIQSNSIAPAGTDPSGFTTFGLRVPDGYSLILLGGDITVDGLGFSVPGTNRGGGLKAFGGRIELGSTTGTGTVGLNMNGQTLSLSFPEDISRANVSFTNRAEINVRAGGSGNITIHAQNLTVMSGSQISAGLDFNQGSIGSVGGDVVIDVAENVRVISNSEVSNWVYPGAMSSAGKIIITAGSLFLEDNGRLTSVTFGRGSSGAVEIIARDQVAFSNNAGIFTAMQSVGGGIGDEIIKGGDVTIVANSISMQNNGRVTTTTFGKGNAGNVTLHARETIYLQDSLIFSTVASGAQGNSGRVRIHANEAVSFDRGYIFSNVSSRAVGNGGDIWITTKSFSAINSAELVARTEGSGNAGNISIVAREVRLTSNASLQTDISPNGQGRGGNINLEVDGTLSLIGGDLAPTGESTRITLGVLEGGTGSGGNLNLRAGTLILKEGGLIKTSSQGQGNAGNVYGNVGTVEISGSVPSSGFPSGIFSSSNTAFRAGDITFDSQVFRIEDGAALSARSKGEGQGGNITVNATRSFEAVNGGQLITNTFGKAQAGNIVVNAGERVTIAGSDSNYSDRIAKFPSKISSSVANDIIEDSASGLLANTKPGSSGDGGSITVTTSNLTVQDGGFLDAQTGGSGKGGNITVNANGLAVANGGQLRTTTSNIGQAGNITLNTSDIRLSGLDSGVFTQTTSDAPAGDLTVQPSLGQRSLVVSFKDGAQISASTTGEGSGGNLIIMAPESVALQGNGTVSAGTTGKGAGGNLRLMTDQLTIRDGAQASVSSSQSAGTGGNLEVTANAVLLDRQGKVTAETTSGDGGNISMQIRDILLLRRNSEISTTAGTEGFGGDGGNIGINTRFLVALPFENSDITANAFTGRGGRVDINAQAIFGIQPRPFPTPLSDITASSQFGISGTITINTLNVDPNRGLVALPTNLEDASRKIAPGCRSNGRSESGRFIVTGRGGLPPDPTAPLTGETILTADGRTIDSPDNQFSSTVRDSNPSTPSEIVEAQGWIVDQSGIVYLVAESGTTAYASWQPVAFCEQN